MFDPNTDRDRERMHCGFLDAREWREPMILQPHPGRVLHTNMVCAKPDGDFEGVEWTEDVCPGWAVRQAQVVEIAQAYQAYDKGELQSAFPEPSNVLIEGVLEMQNAIATYDRVRTTEMRKRAERNG